MMRPKDGVLFVMMFFMSQSFLASAEIRPEKIHVAMDRKTKAYVKDGLVVGGDQAINDVSVKDIRRAPNSGFERIVIDLEPEQNRAPAAVQRPPYYQVAVSSQENKLTFTLWGQPRLAFDSKKIVSAFKRSSSIRNVMLLPRIEDDRWTFVFELKADSAVEIFELSKPVRVIMDVQQRKSKSPY